MTGLPASVLALAEQAAGEDVGLTILKALLPDVQVVTQISAGQTFPVVLVRRLPTFTNFNTDERFLMSVDLAVHAIVEDPDGDRDAAILSEAARVALRDAWLDHYYNSAIGSVTWMEVLSPARRAPDWATASGAVQYANLPSNVTRHEGRYRLVIRKPTHPPYAT